MVYLADIMDIALLTQMVDEKYIRRQVHPSLPYQIFNYTEKTTYERKWNDATRQCRGLICTWPGSVIARPFPKFFNWGEEDSLSFEDYRHVGAIVTDKIDGSLGILYQTRFAPQEPSWDIATRGSFTSDQAVHATAKIHEYQAYGWSPPEGFTVLFEIVYPSNRIVCDYGDMDDLVLLGGVSIEHGYSVPPDSIDWPGPSAEIYEYQTFQEALDAPPRQGAEGLVVHFPSRDKRVKLKQDDYVALHRLVTGLNERRVWALMKDGKTLSEIQEPLPEEFHGWVEDTYLAIQSQFYEIWYAAHDAYDAIRTGFEGDWTRKDFALKAVGHKYQSLLFLLLDTKDTGPVIWDMIRPEYTKGQWAQSEDVS